MAHTPFGALLVQVEPGPPLRVTLTLPLIEAPRAFFLLCSGGGQAAPVEALQTLGKSPGQRVAHAATIGNLEALTRPQEPGEPDPLRFEVDGSKIRWPAAGLAEATLLVTSITLDYARAQRDGATTRELLCSLWEQVARLPERYLHKVRAILSRELSRCFPPEPRWFPRDGDAPGFPGLVWAADVGGPGAIWIDPGCTVVEWVQIGSEWVLRPIYDAERDLRPVGCLMEGARSLKAYAVSGDVVGAWNRAQARECLDRALLHEAEVIARRHGLTLDAALSRLTRARARQMPGGRAPP